jgi:hypothetical protein
MMNHSLTIQGSLLQLSMGLMNLLIKVISGFHDHSAKKRATADAVTL